MSSRGWRHTGRRGRSKEDSSSQHSSNQHSSISCATQQRRHQQRKQRWRTDTIECGAGSSVLVSLLSERSAASATSNTAILSLCSSA